MPNVPHLFWLRGTPDIDFFGLYWTNIVNRFLNVGGDSCQD